MQIREIQREDNQQIAAVIREVFISDNFPKTGTAFADVQLDFMFEAYDKPRAAYFVIEKSADGISFEAIGTIDGAGNSNNILYYNFKSIEKQPET